MDRVHGTPADCTLEGPHHVPGQSRADCVEGNGHHQRYNHQSQERRLLRSACLTQDYPCVRHCQNRLHTTTPLGVSYFRTQSRGQPLVGKTPGLLKGCGVEASMVIEETSFPGKGCTSKAAASGAVENIRAGQQALAFAVGVKADSEVRKKVYRSPLLSGPRLANCRGRRTPRTAQFHAACSTPSATGNALGTGRHCSLQRKRASSSRRTSLPGLSVFHGMTLAVSASP